MAEEAVTDLVKQAYFKGYTDGKEDSQDIKPMFCPECGIQEMNPAYMQYYCRYCGAKMRASPTGEEVEE